MNDLMHILGRTARRHLAQRVIRFGGIGLAGGLGVGCALLLADRAVGLHLPGLAFVLVAAAGAAFGVAFAFTRNPDRHALAVHLDHSFDLKDRFGTAESLAQWTAEQDGPRHDVAFAAMVREDADRTAGSLDVRAATPVHLTGAWGAAVILGPLLWVGDAYLPIAPWVDRGPDPALVARQQEQLQQQRDELAESIEETLADLTEDESLDEATRQELQILDDLAGQLTGENSPLDPELARDETAARMNDVADRLAEQAQRDAAAADEIARRFAGLPEPAQDDDDDEPPPLSEEFLDAIKRGDYDRAASMLDEAMEDEEKLTEAQREALAEQLRNLGDQIATAAEPPDPVDEEQREHMKQVLRDQGLDEQAIDDLLNDDERSPQDTEDELKRQNVDEQIARDLARDIDQMRDRQQIDEQVDQDMQDVADALNDAADELTSPTPPEEERADTPEDDETSAPPPPEGEQGELSEDHQPAPRRPEGDGETTPPPTEDGQQQKPPDGADAQSQPESKSVPDQSQPPSEQTQEQQSQQRREGEEQTEGQPTQKQQNEQRREAGEREQSGEEQAERAVEERRVADQPPGDKPPDARPDQAQPPRDAQSPQDQQVEGVEPETTPPQGDPHQQQVGREGQPPEARPGQEQLVDPTQPPQSGEPPGPESSEQATPEEQPGGSEQFPDSQEGGDSEGVERTPSDRLRDLDRRRNEAERQREAAERLRRAARDLSDNMTEEERDRWGGQQPSPDEKDPLLREGMGTEAGDEPGDLITDATRQPDPHDTEDVDFRGDEPGGRTIAEWLTNEPLEGGPQSVTQSDRSQQIQRAQRIAERAVDESAVPGRYHQLIRRYFDRLGGTVDRAASQASPKGKGSNEAGKPTGDSAGEGKPTSSGKGSGDR